MKKLFLLVFLLLCPITVSASRVEYDITNFLVDATIMENGDMNVKELIVLDGTFNGYVRELVYRNSRLEFYEPINYQQDAIYNANGISKMQIKAGYLNEEEIDFSSLNSETFKNLTKVFYDDDAINGDYFESSIQDGKSYKMYYSADNEVVGFLLQYTLEDVAVLHEDVGEVYWTFIGENFTDSIMNLQIQVHS